MHEISEENKLDSENYHTIKSESPEKYYQKYEIICHQIIHEMKS